MREFLEERGSVVLVLELAALNKLILLLVFYFTYPFFSSFLFSLFLIFVYIWDFRIVDFNAANS